MKNFVLTAFALTVASFNASATTYRESVRVSAKFTPNLVTLGSATTFTWSASPDSYCDIEGLPEGSFFGGWSGSRTFAATGPLTVTVWCEKGDVFGGRSASLSVVDSAPTVSASFSPATVYVNGTSSTLSWQSSLATGCSSPHHGGVLGTSGSLAIPPAASPSQQSYTITCSNPYGTSAATSTLTTAAAVIPPPTFIGQATPSYLWSPGWTWFYFYSTDTPGCTVSFGHYAAYTTASWAQCSNAGGTTTAWAWVTVREQFTNATFQTVTSVVKDGKAMSTGVSSAQPNLKQLGIDLSKKRYAYAVADMNKDGTLDVMVADAAKSKAHIVLNTAGQYTIAKTIDNISSLTQIKEVFVPRSNDHGAIRVNVQIQH